MLSARQEALLNLIIETFNEKYPAKYTKGAFEHGGYLGDLTSLELAYNILEEGLDTVGYAVTLIKNLQKSEQPQA